MKRDVRTAVVKEVIRGSFTDEAASERIGYPVKCHLVSDLTGVPDPGWPDALLIRPVDPWAATGPVYAYMQLKPRWWHRFGRGRGELKVVERAYDELCEHWRRDCLPHMEPA